MNAAVHVRYARGVAGKRKPTKRKQATKRKAQRPGKATGAAPKLTKWPKGFVPRRLSPAEAAAEDAEIESMLAAIVAHEAWLKRATKSTRLDSAEGVIAQWLNDGTHALRRRFAHKLAGTADETIDRMFDLVQSITCAVLHNDAAELDRLAKLDNAYESRDGYLLGALAVCSRAIKQARSTLLDTGLSSYDGYASKLQSVYPELAPRGVIDLEHRLEANIKEIARIKPSRTGNTGSGHKNERALLAQLMAEAGVCSPETALSRIDKAQQRRKLKLDTSVQR